MGIVEWVHVPEVEGRWLSGILFFHCFGGVNRHFQAKHAKYSNVCIMELLQIFHTGKYASWVVQKRGKQIQDGGRPII